MSAEPDKDEKNGSSIDGDSAPSSPVTTTAPAAPGPSSNNNASTTIPSAAANSPPSGPPQQVTDVLQSDIGITTLLNRLKQSISSAREFAAFLKKRSSLEEDQATGVKRLAKTQLDNLKRSDGKSGSYATQMAEVMRVHERMGDNGMQFALSLHQMHEDLNELSNTMERGRKQWKHEGLDSEKKATDAEALMQKAKLRYDSLAEDLDRAKTGDVKGSKRLGLKGVKNSEQYEQDLQKKLAQADEDYETKVRQAQAQRTLLFEKQRPDAVRQLQQLIKECDSALTLQLQKFATFNEKLLLGNGVAVSPLTDKETPQTQRSLRDIIFDINNDNDFHGYVGSYRGKITKPSEIAYEKHRTLAPKQQQPSTSAAPPGFLSQPEPPTLSSNTSMGANTSSSQPPSTNNRYSQQVPGSQFSPAYQPTKPPTSSFSTQPSAQQSYGGPVSPTMPEQPSSFSTRQQSAFNNAPPPRDDCSPGPPYPVHPSENNRDMTASPGGSGPQAPPGPPPGRFNSPPPAGTLPNNYNLSAIPPTTSAPSNPTSPGLAPQTPNSGPNNHPSGPPSPTVPSKPVFGVSLSELFHRDQSAVPMVVYQCILAIDTYGLEVEGIYRLSGTTSHVNALRSAFNNQSPSSPTSTTDFRNPANFFHDVNSVANLLKLFFRELPDPLFTRAGYASFIEASQIEEEGMRRDALHQSINDLPDPNYATLRAIVLHLHRVMQYESRNRMGSPQLGLCLA
ncbi:hypothetical protein MBLNU230_g3160t2 [Neophaeotheca triangularis]